mmetsp:Transcript_20075/g.48513  ORF Transcript_20075/g.48513 Transcript_20075/m.48513 type:complete len:208 (-) Transcript_20075:222-845(-)
MAVYGGPQEIELRPVRSRHEQGSHHHRRPPIHVLCLRIGPPRQQLPHHVRVPPPARVVQRHPLALAVRVHVGPRVKQHPRCLEVPLCRRQVQRGQARLCLRAHIRTRPQQLPHTVRIPRHGCQVQPAPLELAARVVELDPHGLCPLIQPPPGGLSHHDLYPALLPPVLSPLARHKERPYLHHPPFLHPNQALRHRLGPPMLRQRGGE